MHNARNIILILILIQIHFLILFSESHQVSHPTAITRAHAFQGHALAYCCGEMHRAHLLRYMLSRRNWQRDRMRLVRFRRCLRFRQCARPVGGIGSVVQAGLDLHDVSHKGAVVSTNCCADGAGSHPRSHTGEDSTNSETFQRAYKHTFGDSDCCTLTFL